MNNSTLRRQVRKKAVRILPVALMVAAVIALILLILPVGKRLSGSGTRENPYIVSTSRDLNEVCNYPHAYFVQTKDIDISGYPNWNPIGTDLGVFTGTYDGNGHKVEGLSIDNSQYSYTGLFGFVGPGGTVKNLGVSGKVSSFYGQLGLLVGSVFGGTVENCWSEGEVRSDSHGLGGLIGRVAKGGIVRRCYSTATITGSREKSGSVGGLCGSLIDGSVLENSYAAGPVSGGEAVGGLVGGTSGYEGQVAVIRRCYALGAVTARANLGGLIGTTHINYVTIKDCLWDKETSGLADSAGGAAKTTAEMKDNATFVSAGWDVAGERENGTDDIWELDADINNGYPSLYWQ